MTDKSSKSGDELESYLEGKSALSRNYADASKENVPEHLDLAILAMAREDLKSRSKPVSSPFTTDWRVPLSLAAVVVLSVTVFINVQNTVQEPDIFISEPEVERTRSGDTVPASNAIGAVTEEEKRVMGIRSEHAFAEDAVETEVDSIQEQAADMSATENLLFKKRKKETFVTLPSPRKSKERQGRSGIVAEDVPTSPAEMSGNTTVSAERANAAESKFEGLVSSPADTGIASSAVAGKTILSAKEWLHRIKEYWDTGEIEKAKEELHQFRKRYPRLTDNELRETLDMDLVEAVKQ